MDDKYGNAENNFLVMIQTKMSKSSYYLWLTNENIII